MAESFQYKVLIRHTADLQRAVKDNLTSLGAELVSAQIINLDQYEVIRNAHRAVNERGADLVGYVQNKVRQDPRHYHAFLGALQSDPSQYGDILTKLEKTIHDIIQQKYDVIDVPAGKFIFVIVYSLTQQITPSTFTSYLSQLMIEVYVSATHACILQGFYTIIGPRGGILSLPSKSPVVINFSVAMR